MVDTTTKTKAAMLLELESIKGLLLEEDDIPILQEVEDVASFEVDSFGVEPFDLEPINEPIYQQPVQQQPEYQPSPVSQFASEPKIEVEIESSFEQPTHDAITQAKEIDMPVARVIVEEQQDFFDSPSPASMATTRLTDDDGGLLNTIEELEKHTAEVTANKFAQEPLKTSARPALAKATGENPFLPAHIRSRLHGNNPPPLFAQETAKKIASTSTPSRLLGNTFGAAPVNKTIGLRNAIIDSLVEKFMPDIEQELREKLQTLTKEQLEELNRYS